MALTSTPRHTVLAIPLCFALCFYWHTRYTQVRKTRDGPEVGPTSVFYSCFPTGMHGPTYIFWANLTPLSLQAYAVWLRDVPLNDTTRRLRLRVEDAPGAPNPTALCTHRLLSD